MDYFGKDLRLDFDNNNEEINSQDVEIQYGAPYKEPNKVALEAGKDILDKSLNDIDLSVYYETPPCTSQTEGFNTNIFSKELIQENMSNNIINLNQKEKNNKTELSRQEKISELLKLQREKWSMPKPNQNQNQNNVIPFPYNKKGNVNMEL